MTNKSKNILLIVGFVFVLILCFNLTISKTINLKEEYHALKQEELLLKNTPKTIIAFKAEAKIL